MSEENDEGQHEEENDEGTGEESGTTRKSFSEQELTKIVQRRETKAAKAAKDALLGELGVSDTAALKALVQAQKDKVESEKSELDKARDEAAKARQEADSARAENRTLSLRGQLSEALSAVLPRERVAAALKLGLPTLMDSDEGSDEDRVTAAIEAIQADVPDWFQTQEDDDQQQESGRRTPPPPSRTTGQRKTAGGSGDPKSRFDAWKKNREGARITFSKE